MKLQCIEYILKCQNHEVLENICQSLNPLRFFEMQTNLDKKDEKEFKNMLNQSLRESNCDAIFGKKGIFKFIFIDENKSGKREIEKENLNIEGKQYIFLNNTKRESNLNTYKDWKIKKDDFFHKIVNYVNQIRNQVVPNTKIERQENTQNFPNQETGTSFAFLNYFYKPKKTIYMIDPNKRVEPIYSELKKLLSKYDLKLLEKFPSTQDESIIFFYLQTISARLETEINPEFVEWRNKNPQLKVFGIEIRLSTPQNYNGAFYEKAKTDFFAFYYHNKTFDKNQSINNLQMIEKFIK